MVKLHQSESESDVALLVLYYPIHLPHQSKVIFWVVYRTHFVAILRVNLLSPWHGLQVVDPEICLRGPNDLRNLWPHVVAILFSD